MRTRPIDFRHEQCLRIEECGLIRMEATYTTIWFNTAGAYLTYFGNGYVFQKTTETAPRVLLNAGPFQLTAVGRELAHVATGTRNDRYLEAILTHYRNQGWIIRPARPVGPVHGVPPQVSVAFQHESE
jgi:hypothetical protein